MHFTKFNYHLKLIALTILFSLSFWFIFYLNIPGKIGFNNVSLETVFANYDSPNYMVIAKCGYNTDCIATNFPQYNSPKYYPAHLPGYPLLINLISNFTTTTKAMLLTTLFSSIFLSLIFFEFSKLFMKEKKAFWLSIVLLLFPARLFVLRQVGAPESLFLATIIASVFYFKKGKYLISAIFAAIVQTLKSPGILLFVAYGVMAIYELIKNKDFVSVFKKYFSFILVPITVIGMFYLYFVQTGDFWAYFNSADNYNLITRIPYAAFWGNNTWVNSLWLEDIVYIFLFAFYGIYLLFKKFKFDIVAVFPLVFTFATIFVAHRDISRYIAPVYPFLLLAFAKKINKKPLKIIFLILIPAILLYSINFVVGNIAPISNWAPFL